MTYAMRSIERMLGLLAAHLERTLKDDPSALGELSSYYGAVQRDVQRVIDLTWSR